MLPTANSQQPIAVVGREREQGVLREHLTEAIAGQGRLVLIGGEAGIGKTTLVRWLVADAAGHGALALSGGCYDLTTTPPYGPWVEIAERYGPAEDRAALTSGGQAERFAAHRSFFTGVAEQQPLVVVLEDLHWADPASLDLLRYLARQTAGLRILIVGTYRDDEVVPGHPLFQMLPALVREAPAERMELRRLDAGGIAEFIARYQLPPSDQRRLTAYLARLTGGNLLFLTELLRTLESERILRFDEGGWVLLPLPESLVPPLLQQVILGRLERLHPATNDALATAAVIGYEVPIDLWSSVCGLDDEQLADAVEEARVAQVLVEQPGGMGFIFSHALVRAAIYERIALPRRRSHHRRVAETLAARPNAEPDSVAQHFQQAGDARAFAWHIRAGLRMHDTAHINAARHFASAATLLEGDSTRDLERAWLLSVAGRDLHHSGDPISISYLEEAERLFLALGEPALAAYNRGARGRTRCVRGDVCRGLEEIRQSTAVIDTLLGTEQYPDEFWVLPVIQHLLPGIMPPAEPALPSLPVLTKSELTVNLQRGYLINWCSNTGRYREAAAVGESLLADLHASGTPADLDTAEVLIGQLGLGHAYAALGTPEQARRPLERAGAGLRALPEYTVLEMVHWVELLLVTLPYRTDQLAERARLVTDARQIWALCREVAITTAGDGAPSELQVDVLEGRWQKARQLAEDHIPAPWLNHHHEGIASLSILDRLQGRSGDAWQRISQVLPDGPATEPGECYFAVVIDAVAVAIELALDAGEIGLARMWIDTHGRWLNWSGARLWQADHQLLRARLAEAEGDALSARQHIETAVSLASQPRQPLRLVAGWRMLGRLDTREGQHERAAAHLEQSLALAAACAAPYERALTLLALAELRIATREYATARALLADARTICTPLDAQLTLARTAALEAALDESSAAQPRYPDGLTPREVEVLRLIAAGQSNRRIADTLFLSHRTVERHIANIYLKIDAHSKAEATAYALRHGLA